MSTPNYRGRWNVPLVVKVLREAVQKSIPQTRSIAAELKTGKGLEADAQAVWHWIRKNIPYVRDDERREEIRTFNASMADGQGDCEDMTVAAVAIFYNMGYKDARANIISQGSGWSHIFCRVGLQGYAVDPIPEIPQPGAVAPDITDTMEVYLLEGLAGVEARPLAGIGAVAHADFLTREIIGRAAELTKLIADLPAGSSGRQELGAELRKSYALAALNGMPERDAVASIMPYVADVQGGMLLWHEDAPLLSIAEFLEGEEEMQLQGIGAAKKTRKDRRATLRDKATKEKAAKPKDKKTFVEKVKQVAHTVMKFNPLTLAVRNGVLLAMRINLFKIAENLAPGYMTDAEVQEAGISLTEIAKLRKTLDAIEKVHFALGGKKESFRAAVVAGAARSKGLGEVVAAASTAAASGVLAKIGALLKKVDVKAILKKADPSKLKDIIGRMRKKTRKDEESLPGDVPGEAIDATKPTGDGDFNAAPNGGNSNARESNSGTPPEEGDKNKWLLPVGIGLVAIVGLVALN